MSHTLDPAVAIPLGMHGGDVAMPPATTRDLFSALTNAEEFFWHFIELCNGRRGVPLFRDASTAISLIHAYQMALGAKTKNVGTVVASLLGDSILPDVDHSVC